MKKLLMFTLLFAAVCVACGGAPSNPVPPAPPPDPVEIVDDGAAPLAPAAATIVVSVETYGKAVRVLDNICPERSPLKMVRLDERLFDIASREAMGKAIKKTEHLRQSYHEKRNYRPVVSDDIRLCYFQTVGNPVGSVCSH
jgi:hypothetical protein